MQLKDVCSLIVDSEHKTAPTSVDGSHPMVRTPNIGRGRLLLRDARLVNDLVYREWTRRATPVEGDLILAREAPVGNVAVVPSGLTPILGQRTVLLRPDKTKVDARYLQYLLLGEEIQGRMAGLSSGATVAHLNMADIRTLELPELPRLPVQQKMGAFLAAYDELIETNLRRIEILEAMAQVAFQEWFVHFRGELTLVNSEIGHIPDGWRVGLLSELVDVDPSTPRASKDENPFVPMSSLVAHSMLVSEIQRRTADSGLSRFINGDTLFPGINPSLQNGKTAFVGFLNKSEVGLGSTEFIVLRSKQDAPEWVYCLARTNRLREAAIKSMTGASGRQRVKKDTLRNFVLPIPPDSIIKNFSDLFAPSFRFVENLRRQNEALRTARDVLLPRLVSGEVDLSHLDIDTSWLAA